MSTTEYDAAYDALVIGAGQAGMPLCTALAGAGWTVALIEREHLGGTCINEGCTPTKTMVASARIAHLARRAADYGVVTGPVEVDMARVRARKRAVVDGFREGAEGRVEATRNLEWIVGEARFTGERTVEVAMADGGSRRLRGRYVVINAGARPFRPAIPGLDAVPTLDSTSIMELGEVPEHLLVLGGGYIGLEFGQMFRRFGSRVTVIQHGSRLLGREDPDVADEVATIMRDDGLTILLEADAIRADEDDSGHIRLTVRSEGGERTLGGTHLLVATGRVPNSDRLDPAAAGVELDGRGFIRVDERLETSAPGVYALGDIKGGPSFTHIAYDDFRILRDNLLHGCARTTAGRMVPYTVFIDPHLGRIGLSEGEAAERGLDVRVATLPMSYVARALEMDEARGFMKAVVDASSRQILGFAMLGVEGGEVTGIVQAAMMGGLPYTALRDAIFPHPTLSEALNTLFATLDG